MANLHKSQITLTVSLDENRVPEELYWSAEDGGINEEEAKAMLLSIWDSKNKESLKIDLWTKDMPVDEMKIFFHMTARSSRCFSMDRMSVLPTDLTSTAPS